MLFLIENDWENLKHLAVILLL